MGKKVFLEWHGCTLNKGESERLLGLLSEHGFSFTAKPENANIVIFNGCAVKHATEQRMFSRLAVLYSLAKKHGFELIVFGCLSEICRKRLQKDFPSAVLIGLNVSALAEHLGFSFTQSMLSIEPIAFNEFVSIIPISNGCLGNCTYCCVSKARGKLKSFSLREIQNAFRKKKKKTREIWLTGTDTACYGLDIGSSLPELLQSLLSIKGDFRIRIGMMNPAQAKKFFPELLECFSDERLFRFLHLPVQSGSNTILKKMNRAYSVKEFKELVFALRAFDSEFSIATDIIAGFPSESERDFEKSVSLLCEIEPDIVNISAFGKRPFAKANDFPKQIDSCTKKERTKKLSSLVKKIGLERNKRLIGSIQRILVSEPGQKGGFVGRTNSYKPVVVQNDLRGQFAQAKITRAFPTFLEGELLQRNQFKQ